MKPRRRVVLLSVAAVSALAACSAGTVTTPPAASRSTATPGGVPAVVSTPAGGGSSAVPSGKESSAGSAPRTSRGAAAAATAPTVAIQRSLALRAPGRLPREGQFRPVGVRGGQPVVQVAYLRPDAAHGSDEAGVVWISQRATRWELHPGWADPGRLSQWNQPDTVAPAERPALVATFNGGFKTPELRGGFYENGQVAGKLLPGAASVVIYRNGHVGLGSWDTEVGMTPQVVAVRQNLTMLIDHGRISGGLGSNIGPDWGSTAQSAAIWRSGLGITGTGDLIFVLGDVMTPQTLANVLRDAGAERGMEMDINPTWMSFMWYTTSPSGDRVTPHKLLDFQRPADRYLGTVSRDFFAVYSR